MRTKYLKIILVWIFFTLCIQAYACESKIKCNEFYFDSSKHYSIEQITDYVKVALSCNYHKDSQLIFDKGIELIEGENINKLVSEKEFYGANRGYYEFLILYSVNNYLGNEDALRALKHYAEFNRVAARILGLHLIIHKNSLTGERYLNLAADQGDLLAISYILENKILAENLTDCSFVSYYLQYKGKFDASPYLSDKYRSIVSNSESNKINCVVEENQPR